MSEKMKTTRSFVGILAKVAFALILVVASFHIDDLRTGRIVDKTIAEALAKQHAGYSLPTQATTPREGALLPNPGKGPVAEVQPEGRTDHGDNTNLEVSNLLAVSTTNATAKKLLETEASWNVKTTSYPMYHSDETTTEWAADTAYCVRVDMPRVMFQDLERNVVEVVYPESVEEGEEGVIVIRVKNKGSGAEFIARATFTATDDLRIVYGSSHPQTAYGGELNYGSIGDGKSLEVNFYTGATDEHYRNRHDHHSFSGADGYVDVDFYRVQTTAEYATID